MKHLLFLASYICITGFVAATPPAEYFPAGINAPYLSWLTSRGESSFDHSTFLPGTAENGGVAVHWTIDDSTSKIRLAVAAPATGWAGFGLAEAGGMKGAFADTHFNRGAALYRLGDKLGAARSFRRALAMQPDDPVAMAWLKVADPEGRTAPPPEPSKKKKRRRWRRRR